MKEDETMKEKTPRELLIKILSEWVIFHSPGRYDFNAKDALYDVADFLSVTDLLFDLKGTKGETFTIKGEKKP